MNTLEGLKTCKNKVSFILDKFKSTRDDDKQLWLAYLVIHHDLKAKIGDDAYKNLKELIMDKKTPTMESIRRIRQKLQEDGYFIGSGRGTKKHLSEQVKIWANNN
jgi:hypothetical protein